MDKSKHTPGPWRKSERLNGPWWHISSGHTVGGKPCIDGRQAIACVHGSSKRGGSSASMAYAEMFEANAHLITAAPELLDACEAAMQCIGELAPTQARVEVAQMLTSAIAKAKGEA